MGAATTKVPSTTARALSSSSSGSSGTHTPSPTPSADRTTVLPPSAPAISLPATAAAAATTNAARDAACSHPASWTGPALTECLHRHYTGVSATARVENVSPSSSSLADMDAEQPCSKRARVTREELVQRPHQVHQQQAAENSVAATMLAMKRTGSVENLHQLSATLASPPKGDSFNAQYWHIRRQTLMCCNY